MVLDGEKGSLTARQALQLARVWNCLLPTVATIAYSGLLTFVILKVLDVVPGLGLRAPESEEDAGLDISLHGERAYVSDGAD